MLNDAQNYNIKKEKNQCNKNKYYSIFAVTRQLINEFISILCT